MIRNILIPTRENKTEAAWLADTTVYDEYKMLVSTDVFYYGSTFPKIKLADGINVWDDLDYLPDPSSAPTLYTSNGSIAASTTRTVTINSASGALVFKGTSIVLPFAPPAGAVTFYSPNDQAIYGRTDLGFAGNFYADGGTAIKAQSNGGFAIQAYNYTGVAMLVDGLTGSVFRGGAVFGASGESITKNTYAAVDSQGPGQGVLVNRLTSAEVTTLAGLLTTAADPNTNGLLIFNKAQLCFMYWNGTEFVRLATNGPVASKTGAYTLTDADDTVLFNSASDATATLPSASSRKGKRYTINNVGNSVITVSTTGGQLINGLAQWYLGFNTATVTVISNGTNWEVIANNQRHNLSDQTLPGTTYQNNVLIGATSINLVILNGTVMHPPFTFNTATGTIDITVGTFDDIFVAFTPQ